MPPTADKVTGCLGAAEVYSKLDINSEFYEIRLSEEYQELPSPQESITDSHTPTHRGAAPLRNVFTAGLNPGSASATLCRRRSSLPTEGTTDHLRNPLSSPIILPLERTMVAPLKVD